ncbi:hypothetical protein ART_2706 [Arthrobacter sp. PAMC 25486]|nr:hypothetical protein ART_2706 [Arthrobacter sp. PAMC 25486]
MPSLPGELPQKDAGYIREWPIGSLDPEGPMDRATSTRNRNGGFE